MKISKTPPLFAALIASTACVPAGREIESLQGSLPDCEAVSAPSGALAVDHALRQCMDHFLTGQGEQPVTRLRALFLAEVARRDLPQAEAARAFDAYEGYLRAAADLEVLGDANNITAQLAQVEALRHRRYGAHAGDFFAAPPDAETAARLADAERVLAAPQAEAILRRRGASPAELHAHRAEAFGVDAARRLAALDRARADFAARYADYRARVEGGAEAGALRLAHFAAHERARVAALDRVTPEARRALGH